MADGSMQKSYEEVVRERMFRGQESIRGTFGVTTRNTFDDRTFIQRMITSYQKANQVTPSAGESMWSLFLNEHNLRVHDLLIAGDVDAVARIWGDPAETDVFCGFEDDMRPLAKSNVLGDEMARNLHASRSYDGLRRLAEAIGTLRLENIEVQFDHRPPTPDVEPLIGLLDTGIGSPVNFPNPYAGEYGLSTSRGVVGYRTIQALYEARRVKTELAAVSGSRVVEIGAGLGRSIYHALQMGVASYTAVDLPFTAMSQAHFMAATIGPENIALFGEADQNKRVRIIPPHAFFDSTERYDLAVNFDSLTEIDATMAARYMKEITKRCSAFLSVNHEFNPVRVCDLFDKTGSAWARQSRSAYWMRKSYVEEVFKAPAYDYEADLIAMRNSTSWRLTAPLRKLITLFRK